MRNSMILSNAVTKYFVTDTNSQNFVLLPLGAGGADTNRWVNKQPANGNDVKALLSPKSNKECNHLLSYE